MFCFLDQGSALTGLGRVRPIRNGTICVSFLIFSAWFRFIYAKPPLLAPCLGINIDYMHIIASRQYRLLISVVSCYYREILPFRQSKRSPTSWRRYLFYLRMDRLGPRASVFFLYFPFPSIAEGYYPPKVCAAASGQAVGSKPLLSNRLSISHC
jgi:hypothetical protein